MSACSHWKHPLQDGLRDLPFGRHSIQSQPGGLALDYIRANLVDPRLFVPIPMTLLGLDNDFNEKIDQYVQRAMADEKSVIYAFGSHGDQKIYVIRFLDLYLVKVFMIFI